MSKYVPKVPSVVEAKSLLGEGKFPYYHPCSACGKACSTPTKVFWQKRLNEFGSVEELYSKFTCRDCRKSKKQLKKERVAALVGNSSSVSTLYQRKPGDAIKIAPGHIGFSVWEDGKFLGTTMHRLFDKQKN